MKKQLTILTLALILCLIGGCRDKGENTEFVVFKAQVELEQKNLELVKNWIKEIDSGNLDIIEEMYARELLNKDASPALIIWRLRVKV